jgi:hypothetical protein
VETTSPHPPARRGGRGHRARSTAAHGDPRLRGRARRASFRSGGGPRGRGWPSSAGGREGRPARAQSARPAPLRRPRSDPVPDAALANRGCRPHEGPTSAAPRGLQPRRKAVGTGPRRRALVGGQRPRANRPDGLGRARAAPPACANGCAAAGSASGRPSPSVTRTTASRSGPTPSRNSLSRVGRVARPDPARAAHITAASNDRLVGRSAPFVPAAPEGLAPPAGRTVASDSPVPRRSPRPSPPSPSR